MAVSYAWFAAFWLVVKLTGRCTTRLAQGSMWHAATVLTTDSCWQAANALLEPADSTEVVECEVQDAPYLLEACALGFAGEEDQVQLALLSAAMKLFFKRPPECQQLLGATLAAASAESSQDVHDRALLYYRSALEGTVCANIP